MVDDVLRQRGRRDEELEDEVTLGGERGDAIALG